MQSAQRAAEMRTRARTQATEFGGLELAGHDTAHFNGAYRVIDERDGWPVLRNENGIWMFRPSHTGY
eukprot:SAG31_NODE_32862_length_350_cov_30.390438_1_plen_66_part_01